MRQAILGVVLVMVSLTGCRSEDAPTAPPPATTKVVSLQNSFLDAITISVDGVPMGGVLPGETRVLTVPLAAQSVSWTLDRRTYSNGSFVPADPVAGSVALAGQTGTIVINNVVGGQPYFTPAVANFSSGPVYVQVYNLTGASYCVGFLQNGGTRVRWGYYRLQAGTTMRVYDVSGCIGPFGFWSNAQLNNYEANTGRVALDVVP